MGSQMMTIAELREHLIERGTTDAAFRARLLADPKAAIKEGLGMDLPAGFNIVVHEDLADTGHLVLPPSAALGESELSQAAGGSHTLDEMQWRG